MKLLSAASVEWIKGLRRDFENHWGLLAKTERGLDLISVKTGGFRKKKTDAKDLNVISEIT